MAVFPDSADGESVSGPRTLRLAVAVAALACMGMLAASAFATSRSETNLPSLNQQVLAAVNSFRVAHGLAPLHDSPALDRSARRHSLEMGRVGYFAHTSPNGAAFWRRIQRYYPVQGYAYWAVGENLLWAPAGVSASHALQMWAASPEHLRNMLAPQWRQIGISAVGVAHAPGVYGGRSIVIITNDFGVRRR
jgi:uncharacterized protein YkwD